jgi:hypothetical protein
LATLKNHPSVWFPMAMKSFSDIFKTLVTKHGGKNVRNALMAEVYSRENYRNGNYEKAKLIPKNEEQYPTSLPERLPFYIGRVFKASENAFLNSAIRARVNTFDLLYRLAKENGTVIDASWVKDAGKIINSLTSRGDIGVAGRGGVIQLLFWAPKMIKGHWDVMTMHTGGYGLDTPWGRREAAKNLMRTILTTATVAAIANAIKPGTVELDPRSTDFMRIKVGNTRFDITGGAGSLVTLVSRAIPTYAAWDKQWKFRTKTAEGRLMPLNTGQYGSKTVLDVGFDFAINKLTPISKSVADVYRGRNFSGDVPNLSNTAFSLLTPISIQNFVRQFYDGPDPENEVAQTVGNVLDLIGINASTYSRKK